MKGIYKYTDLKTGEIVYVGKDSHIDKNQRHKDHLKPSRYDAQQINRVLQNNPDRYEYGVIWATEDCTNLKLNKMEILFGKIYNPKFNFGKFGAGGSKGHTEETKKKISEAHKGKTLSDETKKKISEANKGKTFSDEHKKKLSEANKGKTHSDETKKKISEAHKGQIPWNKGKTLSEEHKKKMSEARKGKTRSDETKKKISEARNTSGYFRVTKHNCKSCKQGFTWQYNYYEDGKPKSISSVDIKKLEAKVKAKGLKWERIEK